MNIIATAAAVAVCALLAGTPRAAYAVEPADESQDAAEVSGPCAAEADNALIRFYGLPEDAAHTSVCRTYGLALMKSMLSESEDLSKKKKKKYIKKAKKLDGRAVKKCEEKRAALIEECSTRDVAVNNSPASMRGPEVR